MKKLSIFKNIKPSNILKYFVLSDWFTTVIILVLSIAAMILYKDDILALFISDKYGSARFDMYIIQRIGISLLVSFFVLAVLLYILLREYKIQSKFVFFGIIFLLSFVLDIFISSLIVVLLILSDRIMTERLLFDVVLIQMAVFIFGMYVMIRNIAQRMKKDTSDRSVLSFQISLLMRKKALVWLVPTIILLGSAMIFLTLSWPYVSIVIASEILVALYASLVISKQLIKIIYRISHLKRRKHE